MRVLGPQLVRLGAARNVERLVLDRLDRPEAVLQGGDLRDHRLQVERLLTGARKGGQVAGRAVAGIGRRRGVGGDGGADHDGGDGHDDEEQDE